MLLHLQPHGQQAMWSTSDHHATMLGLSHHPSCRSWACSQPCQVRAARHAAPTMIMQPAGCRAHLNHHADVVMQSFMQCTGSQMCCPIHSHVATDYVAHLSLPCRLLSCSRLVQCVSGHTCCSIHSHAASSCATHINPSRKRYHAAHYAMHGQPRALPHPRPRSWPLHG